MKPGFLIGNMRSPGGTERVLCSVANGLLQRGYEPVVISMWGEGEAAFVLDEKIRQYRLAAQYPHGILANLKNIAALYRIVRKERITVLVDVDLILTFYSLPVKILRPGLKRIAWEHFNYYYQFRKNNRIRRLAMRLAAAFSDALVVLSKEDMGYYADHLSIRGLLCQIYDPNPYENVTDTGKEEKLIFAAGRLTRAKGFDLLLESWALLEKDFPDWNLVIAGSGEEEAALKASAQKKGLRRVTFAGLVREMEAWYRRSAFFVLPSRYEGFGMVLVEAMAHARPVVSYACKAGPSDIVTDGTDGFLVPEGDPVEFAKGMRRLMESEPLRKEMGKHAKRSVERFELGKILDRWEDLLGMVSHEPVGDIKR